MLRIASIAAALLAIAAGALPAQTLLGAAPTPSSVELLPGWPTGGGERTAGLRIRIDEGWKTYWRAPGETGVPPRFDWSGSRNLAAVEVDWPRPEVFDSFGMRTIGYLDDVTLPLRLVARDPARPIELRVSMSYGVCSEICVPEEAEVALEIPPGVEARDAALVAATRSLPKPARDAGLVAAACSIFGAGAERRFAGAFSFRPGFPAAPVVVVEGQEDLWFATADVALEGDELTVDADVEVAGGDVWIDRSALRVTFLTESEALDLKGCEG